MVTNSLWTSSPFTACLPILSPEPSSADGLFHVSMDRGKPWPGLSRLWKVREPSRPPPLPPLPPRPGPLDILPPRSPLRPLSLPP